ncbi:MAG: hypothetical protein ABW202_12700 [Duganella sp.]
MKRILSLASLLAACCLPGGASAANDPTTTTPATADAAASADASVAAVVVSSSKDPDWKTYRAFTAGLDVFDAQRQLAPQAVLRFVLLPKRANASLDGVKLRIAGDELSIPIPVEDDGTFKVPRSEAASKEDAELLLNRKPGTFRWRPDVRTPGTPANSRRLGDLRLECAVRWAIEQHETPYLIRKLIGAAGQPCIAARIKNDFIAPGTIVAMYLSSGDRRVQLPADMVENGGTEFVAPVQDTSWPDDALLEFDYAPLTRVAKWGR